MRMGGFGRKAARSLAAILAAAFAASASVGLSERTAREAAAPSAGPVVAVGHRGAKHFAPENTLAAFDKAIGMGARIVEMDVRMTADGHFIVMHDARVDRTTDGRGPVAKLTLAAIGTLDAGSWFAPEFAGERVPTLREALRHVKGRAGVDIDFKAGPEDSAARIAAILDEEGYDDGALVTVFVRAWHYRLMRPLPARYALRPHYRSVSATREARADGVDVMGLRRRDWSFRAARAIADNGIVLFANVMGRDDGPKGFDAALRAGARFIQTDRLDLLVPYLEERGLLADCAPTRDLACFDDAQGPVRLAVAANRAPISRIAFTKPSR